MVNLNIPVITIQPDWAATVRQATELGMEFEGPTDNLYSVRLLADGRPVVTVEQVDDLERAELIAHTLREHLSTGAPWVVGEVALVLPEH